MATHQDVTSRIQSGTVDGMLAYLDYLVDKGYAEASTVTPWASAAKRVFSRMEGDEYESVSVDGIDLDEYMDRFAKKFGAEYHGDSLRAYGRRVRNAIESYAEFRRTGKPPTATERTRRRSAGPRRASPAASPTKSASAEAAPRTTGHEQQEALMDVPFPLESGSLAYLRLPRKLSRGDADRLGKLVQTFVVEGQKQITTGAESG